MHVDYELDLDLDFLGVVEGGVVEGHMDLVEVKVVWIRLVRPQLVLHWVQ
jgi:hypothetical protein